MLKTGGWKVKAVFILSVTAVSIFSPLPAHATTSSTYSRILTLVNGSELRVSFFPSTANLETKKTYSYRVTMELSALAPDLDGIYSIGVRLRFSTGTGFFKSDLDTGIGDLEGIGAEKQDYIQLTVPPAGELSLVTGEAVEGELQFMFFYSEIPYDGDKNELPPYDMAIYTERSTGWETITQGKVTNPVIDLTLIGNLILIAGCLAIVASIIFVTVKKRLFDKS